ncbi:RHS repeat-associated core domain-containing protein [Marinibactrum halimedae]|uniref:RHS repeat-associated core domain-containing protein n=1 Tax=Marinibactrum halimedae TaxID=1444977 RepID=UPI0039F6EE28
MKRYIAVLLTIVASSLFTQNVSARFLQSDPIGQSDGPNTYVYVGQNPTNYIDPNGQSRRPSSARPGSGSSNGSTNYNNYRVSGLLSEIRRYDPGFRYPALTNQRGFTSRHVRDLEIILAGYQTHRPRNNTSCNTNLPSGGTYSLVDSNGQVVRTGRSNDLARRQQEHLRDPILYQYQFRPEHRTDSYSQQRGAEQYLHNLHNPPLNYRLPISPSNPRKAHYMNASQCLCGE